MHYVDFACMSAVSSVALTVLLYQKHACFDQVTNVQFYRFWLGKLSLPYWQSPQCTSDLLHCVSISCLLSRSLLLLSQSWAFLLVWLHFLLLSSTRFLFCFSHGSEAVLPNLCVLVSNNFLQFRLLVIKLVFSCSLFIFLYCLLTI